MGGLFSPLDWIGYATGGIPDIPPDPNGGYRGTVDFAGYTCGAPVIAVPTIQLTGIAQRNLGLTGNAGSDS